MTTCGRLYKRTETPKLRRNGIVSSQAIPDNTKIAEVEWDLHFYGFRYDVGISTNLITMSKTVQLHPDKLMEASKDYPNPIQLDLFQTIVNHHYSNSVELYQTLPDVFAGKQDKLRNADWTLPVLVRQWMYNKTAYTLSISPANVTKTISGKVTHKAFYKTVIAEFIEHALHKLSITDGFFLNNEKVTTDDFGFITTLYQVREELKRMGKTYSYEQIKEWLHILAGLRYEITGEISKEYGIGSVFSPIDLTIRYDKKNPNHSQVYVRLNSLISKRILARDWRGFNYDRFMQLSTSFWRAFFMRLSHRFTQADSLRGYHFKLTTLIAEWVLQDDKLTTNIKKINEGLKDCAYLIDRYEAKEQYRTNPKTNRRQLVDYVVTVFPTEAFQKEQYRENVHQKNLANHRINAKGKPVIKPMRDQYPTTHDFSRYTEDMKKYNEAKPQKN